MQSSFRFVMRSGPTVGQAYPLEKSELFIGRDLSNDIVINDPEISRRHARLLVQGSAYVLEDLGSTNGTFVNGQRLMGPTTLRPGDMITFGERLSLVFESADYDADATMASPTARPPMGTQVPSQARVYNTPPAYPAAQPAYQQPPGPVDSYSGQIPSDYAPEEPVARRIPVRWIVVAAVLLLACLCLAIAAWNAPKWFWCLFPVWPAGACP